MSQEKQSVVFVGFYGSHQKPSDYRIISCLLMDPKTGDVLSRGLSICAAGDSFDKEDGQTRAFGRAEEGEMRERFNLPERQKTRIRRPEVMNGMFESGFWVTYCDQEGKTIPCLPTLVKYEGNGLGTIVLTHREQLAVDSWRRQGGSAVSDERQVQVG